MRENIGAVRKLVNRADKANAVDDTPQSLIANHRRQCVCEALSMDHAKWAIVVEARRRIERSCDGERVLHRRDNVIDIGELLTPLCPCGRSQDVGELGSEALRARKLCERCAEPLAVGRIAALQQETQAHQVTDQPRGDNA